MLMSYKQKKTIQKFLQTQGLPLVDSNIPDAPVRFVHLHRAVAKKCGGSRGSTVRFLQCLHRMLGKFLIKVLFEGFGRGMVKGVASLMSSDGVVKSCKF